MAVNESDSASTILGSTPTPTPSSLLLPTELWLHILEQATAYEAVPLWVSVRFVSRQFKACAERLFQSVYLPTFGISLALPRRDAVTGQMKWSPTPVPGAQMKFSFDCVSADQNQAFFISPVTLREGSRAVPVDELRTAEVLTKERLEAAPPYVLFCNNALTGVSMNVPANFDWDPERKLWTWQVDWRTFVNGYCMKREKAKHALRLVQNKKQRATMRRGR